jgi:amicyanin
MPLTSSSRRAALGMAAIGVAALGLSACGGGSAASAPSAPASSAPTTAAAPGASAPSTTMDMHMSMPATSAVPGPPAATSDVTITNFAFAPAAITVKVGTTVTWTNKDEEPHTVFSSAGGMKSPVLASNQSTYSFTFTTAGSYDYNCTIHPFMHGNVTVTP